MQNNENINIDSISELNFSDLILGPVYLLAKNPENTLNAYQNLLGFEVLKKENDYISFGVGKTPLLNFQFSDDTIPKTPSDPGLYHVAILLPNRADLARLVNMLTESNIRFASADHLVSEAIYLYDSDGIGIEIYTDRERDEWIWKNGIVSMDTLPLDIDDLLDEISDIDEVWSGFPDGTKIGHIHLQVPDLKSSLDFYSGKFGLNVVSHFPGAKFLSAGGYHHHIGLNEWHTKNADLPDEKTAGIKGFEVTIPDSTIFESFKKRVALKIQGIKMNDNEISMRDSLNNFIKINTIS
ncbi:MAG TPA: VOC family protein [Ignavibacteria bacterium]|nr:VOC family protein [Ignavibacteria bacterium]